MVMMSQIILLVALLLSISSPCFSFQHSRIHHPHAIQQQELKTTLHEYNSDNGITVYENAFNPSACEMLHYLTIEHNQRASSSFFTRPPHNEKPLTPIEHAIHSALTEMGDCTKRVEYWSRDEYMNIDVHADIDEAMLEDEGIVRCPMMGHVLYLMVKEGLHGPTCVFPNEQVGWGVNNSQDAYSEEGSSPSSSSAAHGNEKKLVTVPAVTGRILRFPGAAMHSVPKPPHRWLLSKKEEKQLREDESCEGGEDVTDKDWLDDDYFYDDDDEEIVERSVLLFNTWADDEPGPRGVTGDIATGALPEGIELSQEDADAYLKSQEAQILREWEEDYGKNGEKVRCRPFSDWSAMPINDDTRSTEDNDGNSGMMNISLMGMQKRRFHKDKYVAVRAPIDRVKEALEEISVVSSVQLVVDEDAG